MIEIDGLYAGYEGTDVLKNISLSIAFGESAAIIGPNGCGKTTLLRVIAGLLPYKGSVKLDGKQVSSIKRGEIAKKLAIMTQLSSSYFTYTIRDAVMLGRYAHMNQKFIPRPSAADNAFVDEILRTLDLYDLRRREITKLSGGQLQRVFLARTLAQDPQTILLDEPSNHLDLKYQSDLIDLLKNFSAQKKRGIIGVFHDINMAISLSPRIILMKGGEIVRDTPSSSIVSDNALNTVYGMDVAAYMLKALKPWERCPQPPEH